LWTDDDLAELARLCNKFPGGTPQRWETIAEFLNRPVPEVTFMAKKVLEKLASKPEEEPEVPQVKTKVKTKGGKADSIAAAGSAPDAKSAESWGAEEQKALEYALQCYPKGSNERWEKIANMVPNRTKEECMLRFKYVADLVKKKKEPKPEEEAKPEVPEIVPEAPKPDPPVKASATEAPTEMVESTSWEPVKVKTKSKKKSNKPSAPPAPEKVEEPVAPVVEIISAKVKNVEVKEPELQATPVVAPAATAPQITTPIAQEDPPVSPTLPQPSKKDLEKEPLSLLETSVEDQLKSLVEESLHKTPSTSTTTKEKEPLTRSDSKSSTDGEPLVVVRRRGSKEASIERKNSSSSENDWCVIDEEPSQ
jgi:hypothetical protein